METTEDTLKQEAEKKDLVRTIAKSVITTKVASKNLAASLVRLIVSGKIHPAPYSD